MGQIFNRIKNIIQSNYSNTHKSNDSSIDGSDDDLKRIIDELAKEYHNSQNKQQNYSQSSPKEKNEDKHIIAFKVLNISPTNDFNLIKNAYKKQISKYHPDKTDSISDNDKAELLKKAQEINAAYTFLKKHFGI